MNIYSDRYVRDLFSAKRRARNAAHVLPYYWRVEDPALRASLRETYQDDLLQELKGFQRAWSMRSSVWMTYFAHRAKSVTLALDMPVAIEIADRLERAASGIEPASLNSIYGSFHALEEFAIRYFE
ncbi:hypothetical protein [Dyella flagellata]|uniref:Uncharacterized protein n=1 Tax=Dyella flagellata TaxID=1867833 RepID=A0ABQ5XEZ4_9GAMM|nr:hypothetical protein [Dyella flagellata]GLQ90254.1 hypothetical protein GCM10007898_38290 [Dyella flagellata]